MQERPRITLRQLLFSVGFLAAFLFLIAFLFTYRRDERIFENTIAELFQEEMSGNTLNMHYTLAFPEHYGIRDYEVSLPCYSMETRLDSQADTENLIALLGSLRQEKLSEENRYTCRLLLQSLENSLAMSEYPYFEEPLSPVSGMQSQLPILLAEYTFRREKDVEDYLKLLDQTDEYFASLLTFEQEKAAAGLLMPTSSLKKVIEQCSSILDKASLEKEQHFLQDTFRERLLPLVSNGVISLEKAQKYAAVNNRLLRTVMQPAYEALADGLCLLQDDSIPLAGLAAHKNGAAYYELLLSHETGSGRSAKEVKELLVKQIDEELAQIDSLLNRYPNLKETDIEKLLADSFPYQSALQMLPDLQQRIQTDFPPFADNTSTSAVIKSVSESLQEYCAPAFYLTPPLDDTSSNVIYINEKNPLSNVELYTTLAHEGYPGHLYQSVYYNRLQDNSAASQVRQLLWYGGYLEGWALYVEFLSFDYASQILMEKEERLAAAAVQLEKHNRSLLLCIYSLIDVMIHYENAPQPLVTKLLNSFGITDSDSVSAIYEYIAEEPANYPKYYLGYLEILDLKALAQTKWGNAYSDYFFHTFYLTTGPSDFNTLRERLEATEAGQAPLF